MNTADPGRTAAETLAASKLIIRGKAYRLGIEINKNTPAYPPRTFEITVVQPGQTMGTTIIDPIAIK